MVQVCGRLGLVDGTSGSTSASLASTPVRTHLEGDLAGLALTLSSPVDDAHAAAGDLADQLEVAEIADARLRQPGGCDDPLRGRGRSESDGSAPLQVEPPRASPTPSDWAAALAAARGGLASRSTRSLWWKNDSISAARSGCRASSSRSLGGAWFASASCTYAGHDLVQTLLSRSPAVSGAMVYSNSSSWLRSCFACRCKQSLRRVDRQCNRPG